MTITAAYPIAPPVENLRGTILDAATTADEAHLRTNDPVGVAEDIFPSFNCLKFLDAPVFCGVNDKDLTDAIPWQDGILFGAYGGVTCSLLGSGDLTLESGRIHREVEKVFLAGEHKAVEAALMAQRFRANAAGGAPGEWAAPADVNAAAAVHPRVALAMLEGHAASNYVGVPTIHMPRVIASLLIQQDVLEFDGNMLRTKLGSKVAAGGGYDFPNTSPTGTANAAGERWLYASGEVVITRGELIVKQGLDLGQNDTYVLAERPYLAAVDCYTSAVRATVAA